MDLNKVNSRLKAQVVNIDKELITTRVFENDRQQHTERFAHYEFYSNPEPKEYFIFESGQKDAAECWKVEKPYLAGKIEKIGGNLVTILLDKDFISIVAEMPDDDPARQNVKIAGKNLEIALNNVIKPEAIALHEGDVIVYRKGAFSKNDSDETAHYRFYSLWREYDSLLLEKD
jgi:hypothetical protein